MLSIIYVRARTTRGTAPIFKRPFVQSNVNGRRSPTQPSNHATHPA